MAKAFTDQNFQGEVLASTKPVLVDFWAPWCGPCKMLGPVIEKLAKDLEAQVTVGKLNVDESPQSAGAYDVQGIPTLILFKDGKEVARTSGFKPEPQLRQFIFDAIK